MTKTRTRKECNFSWRNIRNVTRICNGTETKTKCWKRQSLSTTNNFSADNNTLFEIKYNLLSSRSVIFDNEWQCVRLHIRRADELIIFCSFYKVSVVKRWAQQRNWWTHKPALFCCKLFGHSFEFNEYDLLFARKMNIFPASRKDFP